MSSFVKKAEKIIGGCEICLEQRELGRGEKYLCPWCKKAQATALDFLQNYYQELGHWSVMLDTPEFNGTDAGIVRDEINLKMQDITRAIEILENHSPKDSARRSGARETGYKESKDNPQIKPEPSAEGASSAMDEKGRSFTRDKPADAHSPRNMKETAVGFASNEALKSGSEMSLSPDSGDYPNPQTSSAGEWGISPGTQGQPYPTPQASPADREEVKE